MRIKSEGPTIVVAYIGRVSMVPVCLEIERSLIYLSRAFGLLGWLRLASLHFNNRYEQLRMWCIIQRKNTVEVRGWRIADQDRYWDLTTKGHQDVPVHVSNSCNVIYICTGSA